MSTHDENKESVGADEAPKLKLSEIAAAFEDGRIEPDCKAGLVYYDENHVWSLMPMDKLSVILKRDTRLLLVHSGVPQLIKDAMNGEPEALGALAAAMGRSESRVRLEGAFEELGKALAGKEGDHE